VHDLGFVGLLLGGGSAAEFVEATIGPVLAYHARRSTELLRTLEAYFAAGETSRAPRISCTCTSTR
jgi:DNA-binding PucR family transcriptional regulator